MKKILLLLIYTIGFIFNGQAQCITAGTIGINHSTDYIQYICQPDSPSISSTTPPTGLVSSPTYTWFISINGENGPWNVIDGATNETYIPSNSSYGYYRRQVADASIQSTCNNAMSNIILIIPRPIVYGGLIGGENNSCINTSFTMTNVDYYNAYSYNTDSYYWEESTNSTDWSIIDNANENSFTTSKTNAGIYYYRRTTRTNCGEAKSNIFQKVILERPIVSVKNPGLMCVGTTVNINATTKNIPATAVYQWYLDNKPVGTNSLVFSYVADINDNEKNISLEVTSSEICNNGTVKTYDMPIHVVISATPSVLISTDYHSSYSYSTSYSNCLGVGINRFYARLTNLEADPVYQWYEDTTPIDTDTSIYYLNKIFSGDIWVQVTSNLTCLTGSNTFTSNKVRVDIRAIPMPVINEGDQTICAGSSTTFTANVGSGTKLQWCRNTPDMVSIQDRIIAGATNATYIATEPGLYSIIEDNGICNSESIRVPLTIDPCGSFSTRISGPDPITPGQQNAVYSVFNQSGFSYQWIVTGGTIVSGQNTNSVTVDWDEPNAFARTTGGTYSISVTETNPSNQKNKITQNINTLTAGTTQSQAQSGIKLFPNPTAGSFSIEMPESGTDVSYEILDLTGLSVASGSFTSTENDQHIDTDLKAGMYQIVLKYNNVVACVRLSKVQ